MPAVEFIFSNWQIHFYQLLKMNSTAGSNSFDKNIIRSATKRIEVFLQKDFTLVHLHHCALLFYYIKLRFSCRKLKRHFHLPNLHDPNYDN